MRRRAAIVAAAFGVLVGLAAIEEATAPPPPGPTEWIVRYAGREYRPFRGPGGLTAAPTDLRPIGPLEGSTVQLADNLAWAALGLDPRSVIFVQVSDPQFDERAQPHRPVAVAFGSDEPVPDAVCRYVDPRTAPAVGTEELRDLGLPPCWPPFVVEVAGWEYQAAQEYRVTAADTEALATARIVDGPARAEAIPAFTIADVDPGDAIAVELAPGALRVYVRLFSRDRGPARPPSLCRFADPNAVKGGEVCGDEF